MAAFFFSWPLPTTLLEKQKTILESDMLIFPVSFTTGVYLRNISIFDLAEQHTESWFPLGQPKTYVVSYI